MLAFLVILILHLLVRLVLFHNMMFYYFIRYFCYMVFFYFHVSDCSFSHHFFFFVFAFLICPSNMSISLSIDAYKSLSSVTALNFSPFAITHISAICAFFLFLVLHLLLLHQSICRFYLIFFQHSH